jgi:hypothetical protein
MTLSAEDAKIVALARAARARVDAQAGAAVRDTDGRTYAAAGVDLPSLTLSAMQVAVAMAASAGAEGLEAAATDAEEATEADLVAVRDLGGAGVSVLVVDKRGELLETFHT